jgi:hypothetical protein
MGLIAPDACGKRGENFIRQEAAVQMADEASPEQNGWSVSGEGERK